MQPSLAKAATKLDESKERTIALLERWPAHAREQQPDAQSWSAAQVVEHIARVEGGILEAVRKNSHAPHPIAMNDRIGSLIVRSVLRSRMRVKAPENAANIMPSTTADFHSALEMWTTARTGWHAYLGEAPEAVLTRGVFSHPRGGWFTLPQTVLFLRLHHEHHLPQLRRIARSIK